MTKADDLKHPNPEREYLKGQPIPFAYADLHPCCASRFFQLELNLHSQHTSGILKSLFRPFEGYRTQTRQQLLFDTHRSKAKPWQSAHEVGMAVDFVAYNPKTGRWSWDANEDWAGLKRAAEAIGLTVPIAWDRAHVQAPEFERLKAALR